MFSCLDMFILSYKILLQQDDNEYFFVATIMTKKTIATRKLPIKFNQKGGIFSLYSYISEIVSKLKEKLFSL